MIRAVIFDMGGVLLRTEDPSPREELAAQLGISRQELELEVFASPSAIEAEIGATSEEDHWNLVLEKLGIIPENRADFRQKFWAGDRWDQDLTRFVGNLRPQYKTGLLSNAWNHTRTNINRYHHNLDVFDVSVFSAEIGMRKPDHRFFNWLLERLNVLPEESVFVDDFMVNITAARDLGFKTVWFQNPVQAQQEVLTLLDHRNSALV